MAREGEGDHHENCPAVSDEGTEKILTVGGISGTCGLSGLRQTSSTCLCWGFKLDISRNLTERERQRTSEPDAFDGQMLWVLWRHIRRADRRRRLAQGYTAREDGEDTASEEELSEEDSDEDEGPHRGCTQS